MSEYSWDIKCCYLRFGPRVGEQWDTEWSRIQRYWLPVAQVDSLRLQRVGSGEKTIYLASTK